MVTNINNYESNYGMQKKITTYECNSFGKKGLEIMNRSIEDFQGIITDVTEKIKKIESKYKKAYEDDVEFYPVKKAIIKGKSIITNYQLLYFEDSKENNLKISICVEYAQFNDEYNLIKDKLI
ncbi:hypothetical protein [Clostridium coskatii]|uniref:Uncharacterized protein n=1 Tax=Clostridium coskatii TaxID=1705578 RepID=A0A162L5C2_9CLOT|nr:hypothetical protein [Clostridium coskatii]OAA91342.1 hypothetical protein WX73_01752 [Clostridium coskatii]OBR93974.1 hypothetical protein CLCOS_21100 [Clostridium coskatii]